MMSGANDNVMDDLTPAERAMIYGEEYDIGANETMDPYNQGAENPFYETGNSYVPMGYIKAGESNP